MLWRVKSSFFDYTTVRFAMVGGINTIAGLSTIYIAKWFFSLDDITSNALGYAFGFLLSFILNKNWTFKFYGAWVSALTKFLLLVCIAYLVNLTVVLTTIYTFAINSYVAQAIGIIPYTLIFYFGCKRLIFFKNS